MTGPFIADYLLLTFLSSCGVFQMAAAWNGLNGLLLLPRRGPSFALGVAACVAEGAGFFYRSRGTFPTPRWGSTATSSSASSLLAPDWGWPLP